MEEFIKHFSHEHELSLFQVDPDADEDPKPHRCTICGLPILTAPSYTCTIDCNFFLHQVCTQLPMDLNDARHRHTLHLKQVEDGSLMYRCSNYYCKYEAHPLVAKPVEIKIRHRIDTTHPLVALCREIASRCDQCGEDENGFFFYCKECGIYIHQDCTILPIVVKLSSHPYPSHPLVLIHKWMHTEFCQVCGREVADSGAYFCGRCWALTHIVCAKPNMQAPIPDREFIHLPDAEETFPSLVIHKFLESNPVSTQNDEILNLIHHCIKDASHDNLVCEACVQPINISSSFIRCHDCDFLAHDICANKLPTSFDMSWGPRNPEVELRYTDPYFFSSIFACVFCRQPSNGFSYQLNPKLCQKLLRVCLECAFAPNSIYHASHKQHLLYQYSTMLIRSDEFKLFCCSNRSIYNMYKCYICLYAIHVRCAQLPKKTRHKFDDHALELITDHVAGYEGCFCEVCEQEIELQWWYYGCHKCKHYFHINCIPSVGYLSKVKFGKTLVDDNVHSNHPLILTRMLTHGRHEKCGHCLQIIEGFSDEIAFHCSPCLFWVHFSCASAKAHEKINFLQQLERILIRKTFIR